MLAVGYRFGGICKNCRGIETCKDIPSEAEPVAIICKVCGGQGCLNCEGKGKHYLIGCPKKIIPDEIWELMRYVRLYEKGLPPVVGGVLDQSASFIESCDVVMQEEFAWKNKLGIP